MCDLTSRSRALLQKLIVVQLIRKFPAFYDIRRFITVCTEAHHPTLHRLHFTIILLPLRRLGHPCGSFPSGLPTKMWYVLMFIISPMRATCLTHLIRLNFIILTKLIKIKNYKLHVMKSSPAPCHFLPSVRVFPSG